MSEASDSLASSRQAIVVRMRREPAGWFAHLRTVAGSTWWRGPLVRLGLALAAVAVASHARRKLRARTRERRQGRSALALQFGD